MVFNCYFVTPICIYRGFGLSLLVAALKTCAIVTHVNFYPIWFSAQNFNLLHHSDA